MEFTLSFFSNVLGPLLAVLAIPIFLIAITVFIAKVSVRKGKKGGPWMILLAPVVFYLIVGLLWVLANVFYGALSPI